MKYIDKLLQGAEVEWKPLGEVCETITDFTAAGSFASNAANVSYLKHKDYALLVRTTDLKSRFSNPNNWVYVDEHAFEYLWRVNLDRESIILPNVGNCGEVYYCIPDLLPHEKCVLAPNALLVRSELTNNKFLYHLLQGECFQRELFKITTSTGQTKFNKTNLRKIMIPIPPLGVQEEIVRILDKFTTLEAELEAELDCRKRQYEYYRDRLLSYSSDEVEWKPLKEVTNYQQPTKYIVNSKEYKDSNPIPVLTAGKTFILGYTDETDGVYFGSKEPVIIFDDFTTANKWVDFDFKVKSSAMKLITVKRGAPVMFRYIYHFMNTLPTTAVEGNHKRQWISEFSNKKIPIPPLAEQERIVRILDKFDTLTTSIAEGLPREIALRRQQYNHYRHELLSFA